jgi:hypothetical protein
MGNGKSISRLAVSASIGIPTRNKREALQIQEEMRTLHRKGLLGIDDEFIPQE